MSSPPEQSGRDSFLEAIAELRERIATVHERVACPACWAPVSVRCRKVTHKGAPGEQPDRTRPALKHPHRERLRADGIPDR